MQSTPAVLVAVVPVEDVSVVVVVVVVVAAVVESLPPPHAVNPSPVRKVATSSERCAW